MSIAAEMDAPLFLLALAAHRATDLALREQLVAVGQTLEELRLAVQELEALAVRPRPAPATPAEVVSLAQHRAARAARPEAQG